MTGKKRVFLIVGILLVFIILNIIFLFYTIEKFICYPVKLEVSDHIGLNTETEFLDFGTIMPEGGVSKSIIVSNDFTSSIIVNIHFYGELKHFMQTENKKEFISRNETKEIEITVFDPQKDKKDYKGRVCLLITKNYKTS